MQPKLDKIIEIAQSAGRAILAVYERDFDVVEKSDASPLTEADLASHERIVEGLQDAYPDLPILSEESSEISYEERRQWHRYWLIDPLDGTKEFIKRNGEFTVNIALIEDTRPVMGVVHVPVTGETYAGAAGVGAFRLDPVNGRAPIKVRVPHRRPVQVAGSRSHAGDSLRAFLDRLGAHQIVSMGSSLKLCLVAEGRADIYPRLGPTSEWDTAAAQAVVEAAGGRVTDTEMRPLRYNTKESLLNPHFLVFGDTEADWRSLLDP